MRFRRLSACRPPDGFDDVSEEVRVEALSHFDLRSSDREFDGVVGWGDCFVEIDCEPLLRLGFFVGWGCGVESSFPVVVLTEGATLCFAPVFHGHIAGGAGLESCAPEGG